MTTSETSMTTAAMQVMLAFAGFAFVLVVIGVGMYAGFYSEPRATNAFNAFVGFLACIVVAVMLDIKRTLTNIKLALVVVAIALGAMTLVFGLA